MSAIIINVILTILYGISGYFLAKVVSCFLTLRSRHVIFKGLLLFAYLWTANAVIYPEEMTGTVFSLLGLILLIFIFYRDRWIVKLSAIMILYPIIIAVGFLTEDIGLLVWHHIFNESLSDFGEFMISVSLLVFRGLIWYLIYRFIRGWISEISRFLNIKMWLLIDAIALTSCISIITVIYKSEVMGGYVAYPAALSSILTALGCCYLCLYISKTIRSDMEIKTLRYQESYYEELEKNQQNIRKLRHDMRHHLNLVHTFLRDNETEQANQYLSQLSDESNSNMYSFCENSIVNAVLNAKYSDAVNLGIQPVIQVELPQKMPVDDVSLCSLIGNTLDNAIEACRKVADTSKRFLTVKARYKNGRLSYEITNAKQNEIIKKNGRILTDKEDKSAHGLGINNIKEIVEKYNGSIDISYDDHSFTVTALI